jgi:uncharacterized protein YjbJ (UPF0337 family)
MLPLLGALRGLAFARADLVVERAVTALATGFLAAVATGLLDRMNGTAKQAEGTIKEKVGQTTGDASLEIEGKVERAERTTQKAFGKAKDALRKG